MRKRTWIFLGLTLVAQVLITLILRLMPHPIDALKIQFAYSTESFNGILTRWSDLERAAFLLHYSVDFLFPWFYGFLLFFVLEDIKVGSWRFLPLVAALFDEIENALHVLLVNRNMEVAALPVALAALAATLKWLAIWVSLALIIANLWKRFKQRAQFR